jgi:hypothetical protein
VEGQLARITVAPTTQRQSFVCRAAIAAAFVLAIQFLTIGIP